MSKLLLQSGKYSAQILHDADDGVVHVENLFDCEPAVEAAKHYRDQPRNMDSAFKHIGEVPMWAVHKATREGWLNDQKAWRKFLAENPDFIVHKD